MDTNYENRFICQTIQQWQFGKMWIQVLKGDRDKLLNFGVECFWGTPEKQFSISKATRMHPIWGKAWQHAARISRSFQWVTEPPWAVTSNEAGVQGLISPRTHLPVTIEESSAAQTCISLIFKKLTNRVHSCCLDLNLMVREWTSGPLLQLS